LFVVEGGILLAAAVLMGMLVDVSRRDAVRALEDAPTPRPGPLPT
jgi:hypothetical protein